MQTARHEDEKERKRPCDSLHLLRVERILPSLYSEQKGDLKQTKRIIDCESLHLSLSHIFLSIFTT